MKKQLHNVIIAVLLFLLPTLTIAQAPPLGTAADFALFTSVGAMQNVGTYQYLTLITGDVGTNSGSNTNFGNVNGVMHAGDDVSIQCAADLLSAYNFLADAIPDSTIVDPVLGNDSTFLPGTYQLPGAFSLSQSMTLDALGNPDAVFIFKVPESATYAFSTDVGAEVKLTNGAQASNVYWFVTGAVTIGSNTKMKGTIIAGGAISVAAGCVLEGRALTINGEVTVSNGDIGLSVYLPVDISAPLPTGPAAPVFVESKQYAVFSSLGDVSDDGTSHVTGSVGSNSALPTGFNPDYVSGNIDGMNPATAGAKDDLLLVYNALNTLTADIELLAPAQFGHNLVLTPNAYIMNSAVTFTDTVILDASGNEDAVFIIKTYGAFESGSNACVILKNGTQAKNVFWMVNGAVSIGVNSVFKGTIIANNGAIDLLTGSSLDGRALTTDGSISTTGMTTVLPIPLVSINHEDLYVCDGDSAGFVVTAIGKGSYTYQWRKGTDNLTNGGNISGVTNDTLVINPVSASELGSDYNVLIFDSLEPSDTSANVSLSFHPVPEITEEPTNQVVCEVGVGNSASFSVAATGAGLTYQWRKGLDNLDDGTANISGATSATLTIDPVESADLAADYNVIVTDTCGREVTSTDASLSISDVITINNQPVSQIECQGSPVSFSVDAIGADLTYQWRKGTVNLTNTGNISGATSSTLTVYSVNTSDVATDYNVIVSGTCAADVTSANASLEIYPRPAAPTVTVTQPTCGEPTGAITVTSDVTDLSFSVDWTDYTNTTGMFTSVEAGVYEVTAKNTDGCVSTGTSVTINAVLDAPAAPTVTVTQSTCGESTGTITVSSATTGLTFSIDDSDYSNTDGIFTSVAPGTYSVTAKNADGCVSAGTDVTINAPLDAPEAPTVTLTQPTCSESTGAITVTSDVTDLSFSIDGTDYTNTSGVFTALAAGDYEVTAKNADGCVSTNTSVTINAQPATPEAPTVTITQPTCGESTGTITVSSVLTDLSFSIDGTDYTNTSGEFTALAAGDYEVTAKNADGCISAGTSVTLECVTGIFSFNNKNAKQAVNIYPNPFSTSIHITVNEVSKISSCELKIYNILGTEVIRTTVTKQSSTIEISNFPSGIYFYKVIENGIIIQSGKLISEQK